MFGKFGMVKFEEIQGCHHVEFVGLEEVLDLSHFTVKEDLLKIFRDGGKYVVRWSSIFGGSFGFGSRSGSQILREVLVSGGKQVRQAGETSCLHAERVSQAFWSILRSSPWKRVFHGVSHPCRQLD